MSIKRLRLGNTAGDHQWSLIDEDDQTGRDFGLIRNQGGTSKEDAEELVRRFNSHEKLVEALKGFLEDEDDVPTRFRKGHEALRSLND